MRSANRRIWKLVGIVAVVASLVFASFAVRAFFASRARLAEARSAHRSAVPQDPPRLDVRERHRQIATPVAPLVAAGPLRPEAADAVSFARTTADEYRQRARYPRWSEPVPSGSEDPLVRDRMVAPVSSTGEDPVLTVAVESADVEAPDAVRVFAFLSSSGQHIASRSVHGTILDEEQQPIRDIVFNDEGLDGDTTANDVLYTARIAPTDGLPNASGLYSVSVHAATEHGDRTATAAFAYTRPDAHLTGRYRDSRDGGDLAVDVELNVAAQGRFHVEATLYDASGHQPIAWAQNAAELSPGTQWFRLRFFGLALRERGIDGPYLLHAVALSTLSLPTPARNRLVRDAYATAAYRADSFSDRPYDDPDLLEAADRIEQAIKGLSKDAGS